ncbi:MAG: hypothetical protein KJ052_17255, partial [Candidatus Hydrogenedentes bacterium]|nr:hypothetical protein [Candidatus Hydrogenedentota bacterium]
MAGNIFLVSEDNKLTRMSPAAYEKELVLQELIEKYPEILDGTQIAPHQPARWICVGREIGVPDEEGGSARWSLDHLFLDQNAIPTFIEVKRSSDTRIRREVVGQMMDYAANGVVYWPVEELREIFERQCELVKGGTEAALREAFGSDIDEDAYWQQVKTNLRAGRVRMVFVA